MNSGDVLRVILMTFGLMFMASIPTVAVIIFLVKYFTRVGKNNREMIQKASEIKANTHLHIQVIQVTPHTHHRAILQGVIRVEVVGVILHRQEREQISREGGIQHFTVMPLITTVVTTIISIMLTTGPQMMVLPIRQVIMTRRVSDTPMSLSRA